MVKIGNEWDALLADEWGKPYYSELRSFLKEEYAAGTIYPPAQDIFNALKTTSYEDVRVVILGQDPYHEPRQAQGLSFSVPYDIQMPPSLINIIKELSDDLGPEYANIGRREQEPVQGNTEFRGILVPWAQNGVLLLNTVLTVRAHKAGSHRGRGWEIFTDRVIELLAAREKPMVFILWGAQAGAKKDLIRRAEGGKPRHLIIQAPHPSPLSAYRGFFGGRYFSRCNYFLEDNGVEPVDWHL